MFDGPLTESILKRAAENGYITVRCHNIRDYATDKHRTADDAPYGGGTGMIMKVDPLAGCIESVKAERPLARVILTTPRGRIFTQQVARDLAAEPGLIIICGRYEGVDERVSELYVDDEISLGDSSSPAGNWLPWSWWMPFRDSCREYSAGRGRRRTIPSATVSWSIPSIPGPPSSGE